VARNAIYFPYIDVPANSWLFRMSLYWERLSSIVPYDYIMEPERLAPGMRDLVQSGLVEQIQPGMYASELAPYYAPFIEHARTWLQARRGDLGSEFSRIHLEKLECMREGEQLSPKDDLQQIGVARDDGYPWVQMPTPLADDFMAYLAGALGQLEGLDAVPVTNSTRMGVSLSTASKAALRDALLEDLLPMPADSERITIDSVLAFKQRHAEAAARLRDRLEWECAAIAELDSALRAYEFGALKRKLRSEIDEVRDAMKFSWKTIVLGSVLPIVASALPLIDSDWKGQVATAVGAVGTVGAAFYQATQSVGSVRAARKHTIAYVALARDRFGS
jgi:hypothetical protein